jgi:hypothetical protein
VPGPYEILSFCIKVYPEWQDAFVGDEENRPPACHADSRVTAHETASVLSGICIRP